MMMKQLIKINTLPLLSISDFLAYKGAVALIITNYDIEMDDPIYLKFRYLLTQIEDDINNYNSAVGIEEKTAILHSLYNHRNKLNKKLSNYLLGKN